MCPTLQYYLRINQVLSSQEEVTIVLTHKYASLSDPNCSVPTGPDATQDHASICKSPPINCTWCSPASLSLGQVLTQQDWVVPGHRVWQVLSMSVSAKGFQYLISFNPHKDPIRWAQLLHLLINLVVLALIFGKLKMALNEQPLKTSVGSPFALKVVWFLSVKVLLLWIFKQGSFWSVSTPISQMKNRVPEGIWLPKETPVSEAVRSQPLGLLTPTYPKDGWCWGGGGPCSTVWSFDQKRSLWETHGQIRVPEGRKCVCTVETQQYLTRERCNLYLSLKLRIIKIKHP